MADIDLEREKLALERDRLALERERLSLEGNVLRRNFGVLVTAAVSLGAIFVSLAQVWIAYIGKEREREASSAQLKITEVQGTQRLELERIERERRWKFDAAKFVSENMDMIFSSDDPSRARIRDMMLAVFPDEITGPLFKRLETSLQSEEEKAPWREGQETIVRRNIEKWAGKWIQSFTSTQGLITGSQTLQVRPDLSVSGSGSFLRRGELVESSLKGFLEDNAFTVRGTWENTLGEEGNFVFRLLDEGDSFVGNYSGSLDRAAEDNPHNIWRGTKVRGTISGTVNLEVPAEG